MKISHLLLALIILAAVPITLYAQSCWVNPGDSSPDNNCNYSLKYVPLVDIPGVTDSAAGETTFASYASALYSVAIVVAALLAVIRLVLAGAKYMMTDVVTGKGEAINDIKGSLLGLLIIIAAYVILNTINPNLTKISIVSQIPNTNISGEGLRGFTNANLGGAPQITPADCQAQGLIFYSCGRERSGCAESGKSGAVCGISPTLPIIPGSQPSLINCDDQDAASGLFGCVSASRLCRGQGGSPSPNYVSGQVSCSYPTPPTAGAEYVPDPNTGYTGGIGTNQIAP